MALLLDSEELVFHSTASTLHFLPEQKALKMSWFGDVGKDEFQETYRKLFQELLNQNTHLVLSDERNMMALSTKGRMWLLTKFAKRDGKKALTNIQKIAVIKARSVFAATLTKLIYKTLHSLSGFEYVYFEDEETALAWLTG
ncbi:MAG TPA: hypothetical protein DCE41_14825 [Cytophagales bacterium]|nr:hypothetical protein [Cytophagales bacterium]HAA22580.1 hypothetical protein [Cytophagales bacterium]HAP61046.1 hypothetical protein [Cytophagales bacterium]